MATTDLSWPSVNFTLPFPVLYEDNHVLAVAKPAMLPTMGVGPERASLIALAKEYLKHKHHKPGNVYLGTINRLDAPVTGIVLFARTSKAAARLTARFRQREVEKIYWAIVRKPLKPSHGRLENWVRKDERHRRMHITREGQPGALWATLNYRNLRELSECHLLEICLETGRKHQIRLQLGDRGHPILGDKKYGGIVREFPVGIALHARRLSIPHPVRDERLELEAPLPDVWNKFLT